MTMYQQTNQQATETADSKPLPQSNSSERAHGEVADAARPLRVYLVEDSAHVRDLLLDFLHVPGEVEIVGYADNEAESVADILSQPVDAVIVDLKLREGGGMAVIEKVRAAKPTPPPTIIVFTNHPFPQIKLRALQLGADYFFDKSADYDNVRSTLHGLRRH
ncbi:MAG: response regulator [Betaproteobacteria bacterium]|nr:response regulator [Betaproteobacteria bacterium]